MKIKFDKKLPTTDQQLRNFIGQTRIMWDAWNEITPLLKTPFIFNYTVKNLKDNKQVRISNHNEDFDKVWLAGQEKCLKDQLEWEKNFSQNRKGKLVHPGDIEEAGPSKVTKLKLKETHHELKA